MGRAKTKGGGVTGGFVTPSKVTIMMTIVCAPAIGCHPSKQPGPFRQRPGWFEGLLCLQPFVTMLGANLSVRFFFGGARFRN